MPPATNLRRQCEQSRKKAMRSAMKLLLPMSLLLILATAALGDAVDDYLNSGVFKYESGDWNGAIADFTKALKLKDHDPGIYNRRGLAEQKKGDLNAAIADFAKAIKFAPKEATFRDNRGLAKLAMGDAAGAIADETKAIELKPDDALAFGNRGIARRTTGDLDGAIADYTKAIELNPYDALAYNNRGLAKRIKGDTDGAIADETKAIGLKPNFERAFYNRGKANQAKGDWQAARADFNNAIKLNSKDNDAYDLRGCLSYDSGAFTNALFDFRKEIEMNPANDYARFRVWLIRARLGERDAADQELQTYLAAPATRDDWAAKVGQFLVGQLTEREFLTNAKNLDRKKEAGQLCEAYFYVGSKRLFAGDKTTATDYFKQSLATKQTDFTEFASATAELKLLDGVQ
jgi:lipoprotein NlpI